MSHNFFFLQFSWIIDSSWLPTRVITLQVHNNMARDAKGRQLILDDPIELNVILYCFKTRYFFYNGMRRFFYPSERSVFLDFYVVRFFFRHMKKILRVLSLLNRRFRNDFWTWYKELLWPVVLKRFTIRSKRDFALNVLISSLNIFFEVFITFFHLHSH